VEIAISPFGNRYSRLWLQVLLSVFGVHFLLLISSELIAPKCDYQISQLLAMFSAIFNSLIGTFMVVWFIIGNVWYYSTDENCATGER
jgi:hypothetical protein